MGRVNLLTFAIKPSTDIALVNDRHESVKISVFLLPGVYGDEPQLSDLRACLADRLSFHTLDLPDLGTPFSILSSIPETARLLVANIVALQQGGSVYIIGFSFGASLALEVVTQLKQADRAIAYLGLIDAPLKVKDLRHAFPFSPKGVYVMVRRIVQKLRERRDLRLAEQNLINEAEISEPQRRSLLLHLRATALDLWQPPGCETAGFIILSTLLYKRTSEAWLSLCPNCRQINVASDHEHIIKGDALRHVAAALADDIVDVARRIEESTARTSQDERRSLS